MCYFLWFQLSWRELKDKTIIIEVLQGTVHRGNKDLIHQDFAFMDCNIKYNNTLYGFYGNLKVFPLFGKDYLRQSYKEWQPVQIRQFTGNSKWFVKEEHTTC